jgi:hypothetical protein
VKRANHPSAKTLILYYSRTGNNLFLTEKLGQELEADVEAIRPWGNIFGLLLVFSMIRLSFGIRAVRHDVSRYDRVILCGPIWTGRLISPIRDVIRRYRKRVREFAFVTACGSNDDIKDEKFGYGRVFGEAKKLARGKLIHCEAFPVPMALPKGKEVDDAEVLNIRLNDINFGYQLEPRFQAFVEKVFDLEVEPAN